MFKKFAWTLTVLLGLCLLFLMIYTMKPGLFQKHREPSLFLIPAGYEGTVTINYGQADYPPLVHEGNYLVYPIPKNGVLNTSTPEPEYGYASDKYYDVDDKGNRTELKPEMILGITIGNKQAFQNGEAVEQPPIQTFHVQREPVVREVAIPSYPSAVVWSNTLYLLSVEDVPPDLLADELGEVKREVHPMPYRDGDANSTPVGSRLFDIKGYDQHEAIAVISNGEIKKAFRQQAAH